MAQSETLYILDSYSRIYQVYHAIRQGMTGPSGQPTHAVFGMFRDLLNLANQVKPTYLIAAFESGSSAARTAILPEYKGTRSEMPEDLRAQIPVITRLFEAFGVPVLEAAGYEADDVIATVVRKAAERGIEATIMTSDKDARQLLGPMVRILNLRDNKVLDVEGLQEAWGVKPEQVIDFLALTGDTVDNVPGVPTIGEGYAKKLLQAFPTLEDALENIWKVDRAIGKSRQGKLKEHADTARRAKVLVTLDEDVPVVLDWEALRYKGYDAGALKAICHECGFHGFLTSIVEEPKPEEEWDTAAYETVDTEEKLQKLAGKLRTRRKFSFDTETTSKDPLRAELVGMSFSWEEGRAFYLPVKGPEGSPLIEIGRVLEVIGPILADPGVELVGQNLKYDMLVMRRYGVEPSPTITDTMVLSYLLESGERNHNLDEMARRLLDHKMISITELIGKGKDQTTMDRVAVPRVTAYAGEDADAAWRIAEILVPKVKEEGLWDLYADLERPLIGVLAGMEAVGVKVDVERLSALSKEFAGRLGEIKKEVYELAGKEFNIGSTMQLRKVLFEEQGLKHTKKTEKGEQSTDAEVLEDLAAHHPLPRLIVQYRQLDKLKGTYLDALPELVHEDGRIHASFNQVVAATGRLSSSDPNLQNIPVRTEDGRQIRQAFVAGEPGWQLLTADYSQIELRVLAHYSKDPALLRAFEEGLDIHSAVAARIFGVEEESVTSAQRRVAKTVNFGVIYGISAYGLATRLGIARPEAEAFIGAYFKEYAGVAEFMVRTLESARETGRVETILGRRRAVSGVKKTDFRNMNMSERIAVNAVIQGSAADLMKKAMLEVDRRLREGGQRARMLLQIHDELVLEAPEEELPRLASLVGEAMVGALKLDVPLGVDIAAGPNWLDVAPLA